MLAAGLRAIGLRATPPIGSVFRPPARRAYATGGSFCPRPAAQRRKRGAYHFL